MFFFKNKVASSLENVYWFVGIHLSSNVRKLEAALVGLEGNRPGASVLLKKSVAFDLPPEITSAAEELRRILRDERETEFAQRRAPSAALSEPNASTPTSGVDASILTKLSLVRIMLTTIQEEALSELLADTNVSRDEIVAVAIDDPGVWVRATDWESQLACCTFGDATLLAEKTGLNVVEAFVAKDWPSSGQGSPLFAFPYWVLLKNSDRGRLLIDLGETARWTFIPATNAEKKPWSRVRFEEVVTCGALLNALVEQTTKGESAFDVGGKLAVQGRRLPALLDFWRDRVRQIGGKDAPFPRYFSSPFSDTLNETFYLERLPNDEKLTSLDVLCTAVHWIAETLAANILENTKNFEEPFDLVLTGAAKQNGLLFNRLSTLLAPRSFHSLAEYGFVEDSFDAVGVAILGILFATGIPASLPELTGAKRESLLGRVAPGTPANWKRFWQFRIA